MTKSLLTYLNIDNSTLKILHFLFMMMIQGEYYNNQMNQIMKKHKLIHKFVYV